MKFRFSLVWFCTWGNHLILFNPCALHQMLVSKKNREEVYQYLFKEGVMVAKKDTACRHPKIDVPNLVVIELMRSFTSRGFVKEQYAWRHYYWCVTHRLPCEPYVSIAMSNVQSKRPIPFLQVFDQLWY